MAGFGGGEPDGGGEGSKKKKERTAAEGRQQGERFRMGRAEQECREGEEGEEAAQKA